MAALPLQGTAVVLIPCAALTSTMLAAGQPAVQVEHCRPAKSDQQASGAHGKCSHCASCVGASAPPAVPSLVLPASDSGAGFIAAEPSMTAYIPATLERPPRLS